MATPMPQEIEVWYLLPALRRELAKIFIADFKATQKEVALILGITEAAVSQYLKEKRAQELVFTPAERKKISTAARAIMKDHTHVMKHLYSLTAAFRGSKAMCELHKQHDKSLPDKCTICEHEG